MTKNTVLTTDRWGDGVFRAARRVLQDYLNNVGTGPCVEMVRPACIHLRKALSDTEMLALSAEWLAIPARDEFSEDGAIANI